MFFVLKRDYLILAISVIIMIVVTWMFFSEVETVDNLPNQEQNIEQNTPKEVKNKTIVVDAGHGGFDPGAVSNSGVLEKNINLDIACKLKNCLEEKGYKVIMTRDRDISLNSDEKSNNKKRDDLNVRRNIVNESDADILVSIHLNFFPDSSCSGMQTFYVNSSNEGKRLAELIQTEMQNSLKPQKIRESLPIKSIYILERTNVPSVVIECGFLSNPGDEANLIKEEYRKMLATAITIGIESYFN